MNARSIGLALGPAAFTATLLLPEPAGMAPGAWLTAGLVAWMAAWWMTEAIPLTATALLPFVVLPFAGVADASEVASDYYSPILFLILGGAFLALAIERTGMHRRLAAAILDRVGTNGGPFRLLLAFMIAAAILSNIISNTSATLIMMPMALAVIAGGTQAATGPAPIPDGAAGTPPAGGLGGPENRPVVPPRPDPTPSTEGLAGALPMGLAFAASIGGLGTIIGSPTNAIGVALLREALGLEISFAVWSAFGVPVVLVGVPLAAFVIARFQRLSAHPFHLAAARAAIRPHGPMSLAEKRLLPVIAAAFIAWMSRPLLVPLLPPGSLTDGTIAILAGLALFLLPDGSGRPLLVWNEANRAPWAVITMFGGGLALAGAMGRSGLAEWLAGALLPLAAVPLPVVALAVVAMVVLVTEFASNVATASGIMPVVASLVIALGADPYLLAIPAAMAASWGFMLPAGTGPNAIAWATGRIRLPNMVRAGLVLDVAGIFLLVGTAWAVAALL